MKKELKNITLIGVDCVDIERLKLAADICEKDFSFGAVKLLTSIKDADPRIVKIKKIKSTKQYSKFCIKEMSKYIETDFALVFQYDGFILNHSAWTDEFLKYDYIGAPWYHEKKRKLRVGNGGFSLRSKKLIDFIAQNYKKIGGDLDTEDVWIAKEARPFLEKEGMKFAPEEIALKFSKEGWGRSTFWSGEFGFHSLKFTDISKWLEKNKGYKDKIKQELNDYMEFMKKYPIYDGTVHVVRFRKENFSDYIKISNSKKNYELRIDDDMDEAIIKKGHILVFKQGGIPKEKLKIKTFERKIKNIEYFKNKQQSLNRYPDIKITIPLWIPKWKKFLIKTFGNIFLPNK